MIYRLDTYIDWKNPKTQDEQKVRAEITEIKNKYFGEDKKGMVKLLYPRGEPKPEHAGVYEQLKIFSIPLQSADGEWRWSASKMTQKTKANPKGFTDHHYEVRHQHIFTEKDVEFIWFLLNRSSVLNRYVFIEDLEAKAEKKVKELASDADITFMLMGKNSPIGKDEQLLRQVASIFGIRDTQKMQINELKMAILEAVRAGEKAKDKFVNYEKFEEITSGANARKAAFVARTAINDKVVGYKDRAWYLMSGSSFDEKIMELKQAEVQYRDQVFIQEVVNNPNVRDRLFTVMGENEGQTCAELRELGRPALQSKLHKLTGILNKDGKKEEILKQVCDELKINYTEV